MAFGFRSSDDYNYRLVESLNNYINWMNYVSSCLISIHDSTSTFNQQMNYLLEDESYLNFNFSVPASFEKIQKELTYYIGPTYFSKQDTLLHQNNKEKNVTFAQLTEVCEKENQIIPDSASNEIAELFETLLDAFENIKEANRLIIEYINGKKYIEDYKQNLSSAYDLIQTMEDKFYRFTICKEDLEHKVKEIHLLQYENYTYYPTNPLYIQMEECIELAREIMLSFKNTNSPNIIQAKVDELKDIINELDNNYDERMHEIKQIDIQHWEKDVPKDYLSSRYESFMSRLKVFVSTYESFHREDHSFNKAAYYSKAYYFYNRKFFFEFKNSLLSYYNNSLFVSNSYFLKESIQPIWFKMIDPRKN